MAKQKHTKAQEEAIANLGNSFIFEISDEPIAPEDRLENWELGFVANNPWWAEPGEPEDIPEGKNVRVVGRESTIITVETIH